ncbi:MAG: hypothetical protein ACI9WU_004760 [Myxococcota bacterium]
MTSCSNDTGSSSTSGSTSAATSGDDTGATTGDDGAATTDGGDTTGDTGGGTEPSAPCASDADCDEGNTCDCIGRCVALGIEGITTCEKDINCGSGNYCDPCAEQCRPLKTLCEPCEADLECADGGLCLDFAAGGRFCLLACVADVGCPVGAYSCQQIPGKINKQCVPLSNECSKPEVCLNDTECPFGDICELGKCKAGCPSDEVCANGLVCTAFHCVEACSDANPCPDGQECDEGHCKIEGGCLEPKDCLEPETFCDPATNLCAPGCLADFDCKASGKECVEGSCQDKGCTGNFFCAFGEVCNFDDGLCEKAEGPYCEEGCDPQNAETSCGEGNMCFSLQDPETEEPLGDFCFVACGPDPNNACPQGYACQEIEVEGGVKLLCFRDCTTIPLGAE